MFTESAFQNSGNQSDIEATFTTNWGGGMFKMAQKGYQSEETKHKS